jgi:hypothetical protein
LEIDVSPAVDMTPPDAPVIEGVWISRSYGPRDEGCARSSSSSSCDGSGGVAIQIEPARDDSGAVEVLGYLLRVAGGELPGGFTPGDRPLLPLSGALYVHFPDPGPGDQEPIDVTFELVAVDRAGNESTPTVARATDSGDEGCAFAGRAHSGVFARGVVVLALSVLFGRRWRRRRA